MNNNSFNRGGNNIINNNHNDNNPLNAFIGNGHHQAHNINNNQNIQV